MNNINYTNLFNTTLSSSATNMATNNIWQLSWNPKNYDTRGRMLAAAASEEKRNMIQSWGRSPITNISKIKTGDIVYISSKKKMHRQSCCYPAISTVYRNYQWWICQKSGWAWGAPWQSVVLSFAYHWILFRGISARSPRKPKYILQSNKCILEKLNVEISRSTIYNSEIVIYYKNWSFFSRWCKGIPHFIFELV